MQLFRRCWDHDATVVLSNDAKNLVEKLIQGVLNGRPVSQLFDSLVEELVFGSARSSSSSTARSGPIALNSSRCCWLNSPTTRDSRLRTPTSSDPLE